MAASPASTEQQRVQMLAEFRYALRQFLQFSEGCAAEAGLHPQQHQLLLHIAGVPEGADATISYAAERLGLRHNTVVELSKRCEDSGLIRRIQTADDRRFVVLKLTAKGERIIHSLSKEHERELSELLPTLIGALNQIHRRRKAIVPRTAEAQRKSR